MQCNQIMRTDKKWKHLVTQINDQIYVFIRPFFFYLGLRISFFGTFISVEAEFLRTVFDTLAVGGVCDVAVDVLKDDEMTEVILCGKPIEK